MLYTPATERSDRAIVDVIGITAERRGVSRAQIALAWLRTNPVIVAPLVGASRTSHIDDAVSSLDVKLTGEEIAQLERPYTARSDFQGVSDDTELQRIMSALPNFATADAARDHEGELSEPAT
jgi:diketogulonate reductase-like aldo/keto reductase